VALHDKPKNTNFRTSGIRLNFRSFDLELIHTFGVFGNSRKTSPVVLAELEYDGVIGYGEASLPPYLPESRDSVLAFLQKVDPDELRDPLQIQKILEYVNQLMPGNYAAKAALDIALYDLAGKLMQQPLHRIWNIDPAKAPYSSVTIGIDSPQMVASKTREVQQSKILKVKLGGSSDRELILAVRSVTDKPLYVDVNQGWTDKHFALDMIHWLKEQGAVMVEQPMPVKALEDMAWLTQHSPLPTIADEAFKTIEDIPQVAGVYNGINIKLMKCGGLQSALMIIDAAHNAGLETMIGCMVETSCAVSAAAQLSPLVRWCDLDGNLLIKNDPFDGVKIVEGKIVLSDRPGIGVVPKGF
jgi:L-Ala-D/L-Glu epimerase